MKLIIAGSRNIFNYSLVEESVAASGFIPTEIISGGAAGVDKLGEQYAEEHGISLRVFYADWFIHGASAGPIRNREMANNADALIALWDGKSRGTQDMIKQAISKELQVKVYLIVNGQIDEVRDFSPVSQVEELLLEANANVAAKVSDNAL